MEGQAFATLAQLEVKGVSKTFVTGRPVLNGVSFSIAPGEIYALAGANGSGKSTMVQILAGYHHPDEGAEILVGGVPLSLPIDPQEIRRRGVRFVHQDNGFISGMSIFDNMCLGRGYSSGLGWKIKWKEERNALEVDLERHKVSVDLDADARTLSMTSKAKLAIIRALHLRPDEELKVVVLDEPTSAMDKQEASDLHVWLKELSANNGIGVLFIGHRPQELRELAHRIGVLRNGEIVATFRSSEATNEEIVEALVGSHIGSFYPARNSILRDPEAALAAENISGGTVVDMSLSLYPGEIVGITGLRGSGFEDLPYLIFDRERRASGTLVQKGIEFKPSETSIAEHIKRGLVLVPSDRVHNSVITGISIRENISQPRLTKFIKHGLLRGRAESEDAIRIAQNFGVTPTGIETKVGSLSGGNQQKVVVGKWMAMSPDVILFHEPTEGIDVMAKKEIFKLLIARTEQGAAILVSSIEYEDLAHICNRILVCGHGRIRLELKDRELSGEDVIRAAYTASLVGDE